MKILLAPSETKKIGGSFKQIDINSFQFCKKEKEFVTNMYNDYINNASFEQLSKLFGIKNEKEFDKYKNIDIFNDSTMPAIERYTGVAFDYLNYETLTNNHKDFINSSLIIFSNLFGPLMANELIPIYKLKQGEKIGDFNIEKYYKQYISDELDTYLSNELIIDLRAGFYNKFYTPKIPYITMKFLKNGKTVSHWAKAYRGKITRELAKYQPSNEKELTQIEFKNLFIKEILTIKNKKEYIFEIIEN